MEHDTGGASSGAAWFSADQAEGLGYFWPACDPSHDQHAVEAAVAPSGGYDLAPAREATDRAFAAHTLEGRFLPLLVGAHAIDSARLTAALSAMQQLHYWRTRVLGEAYLQARDELRRQAELAPERAESRFARLTESGIIGIVVGVAPLREKECVRKPVELAELSLAARTLGLCWLLFNETPPAGRSAS